MRAATIDRYGPPEVVQVGEVDDPRPGRDEVLVRVRAAAVSSGDARIRAARFPPGFGVPARLALGLRRPRRSILGGAFAGEVVALGAGVEDGEFAPGTLVAGMSGVRLGAHAELMAVPARRLVPVPDGVDADRAAGVLFGGTTAMWFLEERATVTPGAAVLVNGASGAVGTVAVGLAARAGATVTAVTSRNADLVRRLGATHVVDHTTTSVTDLDERYDVVFDTVGNLTIRTGRPLLRDGGRLLLAVASLGDMARARGDVRAGTSPERAETFARLLSLVAAGDVEVVVESTFALDDIVAAHRVVDSGHKVGNVLVHP